MPAFLRWARSTCVASQCLQILYQHITVRVAEAAVAIIMAQIGIALDWLALGILYPEQAARASAPKTLFTSLSIAS